VVTLKGRPSIVHPDPVSVHITAHPVARNPGMQERVLFGTLSALEVDGGLLVEVVFDLVRSSRGPLGGVEIVSM
jgi:hypothetical protein